MAIRGVGGIFFKSDDPGRLAEWYEHHLGVARDPDGYTVFGWRELDRADRFGETVWAPFPSDTEYFAPSDAAWMLNYRVDDLDAELERLRTEGVEIVGEPEKFEYGKFGWLLDCDGNKVELWEPPADAAFETTVPGGWDLYSDRPGVWLCEPGQTMATDAAGMADRAIVKECTVGLEPDEVWTLWTTSDGLAEWLVGHSRVELAVGGAYEFYFDMDQELGLRGGEGCRVLSFLEPRLLTFTWNAPPHLDHTRSRHTHVVLEFDRVEEGTHVRLTHLGWPAPETDDHPQWDETFTYFERAWDNVISSLEEYAAG